MLYVILKCSALGNAIYKWNGGSSFTRLDSDPRLEGRRVDFEVDEDEDAIALTDRDSGKRVGVNNWVTEVSATSPTLSSCF